MYGKVIWATDGSDHAEAALREALRLTAPGGRIVAVHCDQRMTGRAAGLPIVADEEYLLTGIQQRVRSLASDGVPIELVVRTSHAEPADMVAAVAEELDADVIVCGSHGHGALAGAIVRNFAHRMLHVAHCPVVVVPGVEVEVHTELQAETIARRTP
jgi:nucleotide-binding universal stress UspA family protein